MSRNHPPNPSHQNVHHSHPHNTILSLFAVFTILLSIAPTSSSFLLSTSSSSLCSLHSTTRPLTPASSAAARIQQPMATSAATCVLWSATGAGAEAAGGGQSEEAGEEESLAPQTFREAEILGLRLMQQGRPEDALEVFQNGLKLPGSRKDILRKKTLNVSPVGGSFGGSTGEQIETLDEFEAQAAHYNIACAYSKLNKSKEAVRSLENAFKAGFDNYATARADPDLASVQRSKEFEILMEQYDPKKGFPFSFFGKK